MSKSRAKASDQSESDGSEARSFDLVASAMSKDGRRLGVYIESGQTQLLIKTRFTVRRNAGDLETLLIESDLDWVLERYARADLGAELRRLSKGREVVTLESRGAHHIIHGGSACWVYVWGGEVFVLAGKRPTVKLVGDALIKEQSAGSYKAFFATVGPIAAKNPRVLLAIFFALSPALRQVFSQPIMSLWLAGGSSLGKNSTQGPCSAMTGPPNVELWDGTRNGLKELFESSADRAACVDEVQLADAWEDVENVIMATGNAGRRKRYGTTNLDSGAGLQSTPILSANKLPSEMHPRSLVPDQVWARLFVIRATGRYGMFDDLAGYSSPGNLAESLERAGAENFGTVWPAWLKRLERDRAYVNESFERRFEKLRNGILKAAGGGTLNALNERVLKRLTFIAFVGNLVRHFGLIEVDRRAIREAFGLLLKEHIDAFPQDANERSEAMVIAVSEFLERNLSLFPAVSSATSAQSIRGLLGYSDPDYVKGPAYLILPGVFRSTFEKQFGKDIYKVLADRGYLFKQGSRYNLAEKRLTLGGKRKKKFFYAISASILHFPGGP